MSRIIFFIIIIFFNNSVISSPIFETKFHYTEFRSNNIENDKLKKIQEIKIVSLKTILKKILIQKDFSKIENKLSNDLDKCRWSVYRGTGAVVHCLAQGIRPIYYSYGTGEI